MVKGDGSLSGTYTLRKEWNTHLSEVLKEHKISELQHKDNHHLFVVGIVGSIDNDFCGTDLTISTDSALHRIIDCIDSISTTAKSHRRGFVIEIMGRHSGYLALTSGLSVGADYVFIPEFPVDTNWKTSLCESIKLRLNGIKNYIIVLVAEGVEDISGNYITSTKVQDVMQNNVGLDTRMTVLGHIQRGGTPSAHDRISASRQGIEASINVLMQRPEDPSYVICVTNVSLRRVPLSDCIAMCNEVKSAYKARNVEKVVSLRGLTFLRNLELFKSLQVVNPPKMSSEYVRYKFAIAHCGTPAAGMDLCSREFVRSCIFKGHQVIGFKNGLEGIIKQDHLDLNWDAVQLWFSNGGSSLGASKFKVDEHIPEISNTLEKLSVNGLLLIGGYDTILILQELYKSRKHYKALRIPIIMVPATISNDIACTTFTLGSDTALNVVTNCCDSLRLSALSSRKRIFIVETFGKQCGYLCTMSALSSAAENSYYLQKPPLVMDIIDDINNLKSKFANSNLNVGLIMVSNKFSENYDIHTVTKLFNEEGKQYFTAREEFLGHMQLGSTASHFDRILAATFGSKVADNMLDLMELSKSNRNLFKQKSSCCMIGVDTCGDHKFFDIEQVIEESDLKLQCPKDPWWLSMKSVIKILAHSDFEYESVTIPDLIFKCKSSYSRS